MPSQKLLVLIPFIPYPLNTGGSQGAFHMLDYIKDYFDVHIWFHINNEKKSQPLINEFSKALSHQVHIHYTANKIGRNYITARALKRKFDAIFLKNDTQYQHNTKLWGEDVSGYSDLKALEDIHNIIIQNDIDLVQIEFSMIIDMVYAIPQGVKKVFIHHELGFARKYTMMKQTEDKYVYDTYRYRKSLADEITTLNQYDCVVTLSDADRDKLMEEGVETRIEVSPLFIPQSTFPNFMPATDRLTYIASGGHYPNVEGLEWFVKNVHPFLVKQMPNYILEICGVGWDKKKLDGIIPDNIHFLGFVEDLQNVIPGSVMIVPILSGSGMRMKILESVNNSVPFVSTVVGAEGLAFLNGRDCVITDEPQIFGNAIVELLHNECRQREYVKNARAVYDEYYSQEALAKKRLSILRNL